MTHWTLDSDPHASREAHKYDKPAPSREYLLQRLEEIGTPISHEEMSDQLGLSDEDLREAVRRRLGAMERDGQVLRNRRGAFALINKLDLIKGKVLGHRDGFGFLLRDDGKKPDLVMPPRQMRRVFHGDHVLVRVSGRDRRGRDEATVVEVLSRNTQTIVGVYRANTPEFGVLIPENSRIALEVMIPHSARAGAEDGQVVSARIVKQPETRSQPVGEIIEVLGERMDPGMEIDIALRSYEIPAEFPMDVTDQIASMSAEVAEEDKLHRVDLRDKPLVTIDDESARDFDDAVCAYKTRSGSWKLLVAIADVSHYVRPGTPLDTEALSRGNSVYFPGQVVPMLPELLSNGLCSLNPGVDRLALVCEMNISKSGTISRYRFYEAVFRSHARLTYNKVSAILQDEGEEGEALRREYKSLVPSLKNLYGLYKLLREARTERGAIDFETTETAIIFNDERKIEKIVPRSRNDAHKIIEECMLAANVATARFLDKHDLPALYRIHERPSPERLDKLRLFLNELGMSVGGGDAPTPQDYQELAEAIRDRDDADIIQTVMLRSMSQAVYSPHNEGHFGLAYPAYAHFTSPIRRYPDLLVHRAIRSVIRGPRQTNTVLRVEGAPVEPPSKWCPYTFEQMLELGEHCSMTERRADDATRDVEDWLKCEFMSDKLGETYDGTIASVTQFGIFVRLDEVYVEGLVHVTSLPSDYYHYEPEKHRLKGERTGTSYRLGDGVTVQVARVDLDDRKIDFEMADDKPRPRRAPRKRRSGAADSSRQTTGKPAAGKSSRQKRSKPPAPSKAGDGDAGHKPKKTPDVAETRGDGKSKGGRRRRNRR